MNPSDGAAIVRLSLKGDHREISVARGRLQAPAGFEAKDIIPSSIADADTQATSSLRLYHVTPNGPISPGEYALVARGAVFYDFGIDPPKTTHRDASTKIVAAATIRHRLLLHFNLTVLI
jgi:hypothetical protein